MSNTRRRFPNVRIGTRDVLVGITVTAFSFLIAFIDKSVLRDVGPVTIEGGDDPALVIMDTPRPPGKNSEVFSELGFQIRVNGLFLDRWHNVGGVPVCGFPISQEMAERSESNHQKYTIQYFERCLFQYNPFAAEESGRVMLALLGAFRYRAKYPDGAPGQEQSKDNPLPFPGTNNVVGGRFRSYYDNTGRTERHGVALSNEFREQSDINGQEYTVQYFERSVLEYHPELTGTEYEVLLVPLGTLRFAEKYPHALEPPPAP